MKIAIADNNALKFCKDVRDHWLAKGHEVRFEIGASEILAQWADLYYIEWWDNNLHYLWNWYQENPQAKKPTIVVRAIDWDVWCSYVPTSQQYVDFIDKCLVIAPHMYDELEKRADFGNKLHLICPGLDASRFSFRERDGKGNKIAMMTGDIWQMKNVMEGLMIFAEADLKWPEKKFELHWRAQYADHATYMKVAVEHFIKSRGLEDRFHLYSPVNSINEWLEPMDFLINPSIKEAFSYSVAEAMAKGIKPIINNWYGAVDIWPRFLYNTVSQAVEMIGASDYDSASYRRYVEEQYPLSTMLEFYDKLLGT